jgi:hypothetical protein
MRRWILFTAAVMAVAAIVGTTTTATAAAPSNGIVVTFDKHVVDPSAMVFSGTTGGAVKGSLESRLVSCEACTGDLWTFTFDWMVTADASAKSFVSRTTGTFDLTTGAVVMDGVITTGWHAGAAVHEQGLLIEPSTLEFAGTIAIHPDESAGT